MVRKGFQQSICRGRGFIIVGYGLIIQTNLKNNKIRALGNQVKYCSHAFLIDRRVFTSPMCPIIFINFPSWTSKYFYVISLHVTRISFVCAQGFFLLLQIMNLIDIVDKYDDSYRQLNKRVLEMDAFMLRYYSKVPKQLELTGLQLKQAPKAGEFQYRDDPKVPQNLQSRSLGVSFGKNFLLSGKDALRQEQKSEAQSTQSSKQAQQTWLFIFKDEETRNRWADTIARSLGDFINQEQGSSHTQLRSFVERHSQIRGRLESIRQEQNEVKQYEENEHQLKEMKLRQEQQELVRSNMKQQEMNRKQRDEEQNKIRRQQQEEEQKRQALQREEEERRRKEEEARQQRREMERQIKLRIQTAWEFRFYQAQENCLEQVENFDNSMREGLKLIKFIETFKEQAFITVKGLIAELSERWIRKPSESELLSDDEKEGKNTIFAKPKRKPQNQKQNNQLLHQEYQESIYDCFKGEYVFKRNNMLIQIASAHSAERTLVTHVRSQLYRLFEKQLECNFFQEQAYFRTLVHTSLNKRKLSDEFKTLNYLNDICYSLRSVDKNYRLKVPLSCVLEYLGFKALIIALPPTSLDDQSLAYGQPKNESYYKTTGKLDREVEALGRTLAIKPHFFSWKQDNYRRISLDSKKVGIFLSVNSQIHVGKFDEFEQLKGLLKTYSEDGIDILEQRRQGLYYLYNTQELLPFVIEERYSDLIEIMNMAKTQQNTDFTELPLTEYEFRRCRPEFLQIYFETGVNNQLRMQQNNLARKQYNPDAYDTADDNNDTYQDQLQLAEMSKYFIKSHITEFVNKLDQLELLPLESTSLRDCFRSFGINMRYLGLVAKTTRIPQIQLICEAEMLARSAKNIFNQHFSEYLLSIQEDQIPTKAMEFKKPSVILYSDNDEDAGGLLKPKSALKKNSVTQTFRQEKQTLPEYLENQYKEMLADLLNLLFSKSTLFYQQILFKQVLFDFDYEMNLKVRGINPGQLLTALCYNLKIEVDFEPKDVYFGTPYAQAENESAVQKYNLKPYLHSKSYTQLFKVPLHQMQLSSMVSPLPTPPTKGNWQMKQPKQGLFDAGQITQMRFDVLSYQMSESEICRLVNKFNLFKVQKNYQLAIKVLHMRLNLIDGISHTANVKFIRSQILTDIGEMHLKLKQISQAMYRLAQAMNEVSQQISVPVQGENFNESFLNQLSNMNMRLLPRAGMIRPLMILFELVVEWYQDYVFWIFDLLIFNLEFSLGPQHHFFAKVFNMLGHYFQRKGQNEDHLTMNRMHILCLLNTIGQQHQMTAEAYIEIGEQKHTIEEQIIYYEKAYYIFETLYSDNSLQTALVSCRLAKGYTDCGRVLEALRTSQLALKILKNKVQDNLIHILELCYIRGLNLLKNFQRDLSRKECEEYFNVLFVNWDQMQNFDTNVELEQVYEHKQREVGGLPQQLVEMSQNTLRIFVEIFLTEMQKEHRNFLYQMFDMVVETLARSNYLEISDSQCQPQLGQVLRKVKQSGSIQSYLESTLNSFIDKTGGDANWLIFNFKAQGSEQLKEAYENYETLVVAIGRKHLSKIFERIFMMQS